MFSKFSKGGGGDATATPEGGGTSYGSSAISPGAARMNTNGAPISCASVTASATPVGGFTRPNGTSTGMMVTGGMGGVMGGAMGGSMGGSILSMEKGPLAQQYEMGKLIATGGPSYVWKIYEGYRKCDAKVSVVVQLTLYCLARHICDAAPKF